MLIDQWISELPVRLDDRLIFFADQNVRGGELINLIEGSQGLGNEADPKQIAQRSLIQARR